MERKGYLYILQSTKNGQYYIGSSMEPDRRLEEHNSNANKATRLRGPWKRIAVLQFPSLPSAKKAEAWIKRMKSRRIIHLIATDSFEWLDTFERECIIEHLEE